MSEHIYWTYLVPLCSRILAGIAFRWCTSSFWKTWTIPLPTTGVQQSSLACIEHCVPHAWLKKRRLLARSSYCCTGPGRGYQYPDRVLGRRIGSRHGVPPICWHVLHTQRSGAVITPTWTPLVVELGWATSEVSWTVCESATSTGSHTWP